MTRKQNRTEDFPMATSGRMMEQYIGNRLRAIGCEFEANRVLDWEEAVDFFIHTVDGRRISPAVHVQLTLQAYARRKLKRFLFSRSRTLEVLSLYCIVEDAKTDPLFAAMSIKNHIAELGEKTRRRGWRDYISGICVRSDYCQPINPFAYLDALNELADPIKSAYCREEGVVIEAHDGMMLIRSADGMVYKAYENGIEDQRFRRALDHWKSTSRSHEPLAVDFVPTDLFAQG
ncbi:MAG: hypothetical protein Q8P82_01320, partial [bacterium]|nr:hypothetical protein [bacterium]